MIIPAIIAAKISHTVSTIMKVLWNSAKLIGRFASRKALKAAGKAVGKSMMHASKLQKATASVLRGKLKYLPKGWDQFKQSALSKALQLTFKTSRFGVPRMKKVAFSAARKSLIEFTTNIAAEDPDFMVWLKNHTINLRRNVAYFVQNRRLRDILDTGIREIIPELDFPDLTFAQEQLEEAGGPELEAAKAETLENLLGMKFIGQTAAPALTDIIAPEDFFMDATSQSLATAIYQWDKRERTPDDDDDLGELDEGSGGDDQGKKEPELKVLKDDGDLEQPESLLQLWTGQQCMQNDTVAACNRKREIFDSTRFLPVPSFKANLQPDTEDPCFEGGCLAAGRIYQLMQPLTEEFESNVFPEDEDTLMFSKQGRKRILGPLKANPYMAMPQEGLGFLSLQLQLDTLTQCRNDRITNLENQHYNLNFTYSSVAVAVLFLISLIISFGNWLVNWIQKDLRPKSEDKKLKRRRDRAKHILEDVVGIATEEGQFDRQTDRPINRETNRQASRFVEFGN